MPRAAINLFLLLEIFFLSFALFLVPAVFAAPYPQSNYITNISWDFPNLVILAPGSDIWPVTWASDDNLYTSWGDGIGFGAVDFNEQWSSPQRASLGFSRISGGPTNFNVGNGGGGENR